MMKKAVSLFLSILMVVSLFPLNVWAIELSEREEIVPEESKQENFAFEEEDAQIEHELSEEENNGAQTEIKDEIIVESETLGASVVASGDCGASGSSVTWKLDSDGVLTISGEGKMADYTISDSKSTAPWIEYSDSLKTLVLGEGITSIGEFAFYDCDGFTGNLVIPDSVTDIGDSAFDDCSRFTGDLVIPDSVISIGNYAFAYCSGFTGDLVIPNSVTTIGKDAFAHCSGFTGDLVFPDSVISIGKYAFEYCSGFTGNVYLSENLTSIGAASFAGTKISEINVSQNNDNYCSVDGIVYSKDKKSIIVCPGGKTGNLVIPDSVTDIEDYAFYYCNGLTGNLVIPDSVISIGECAFESCSGFTGNLIIGDSVTTIGEYAFCYCKGFTGNLIIGNSVTDIEDYAFYYCNGLTGNLVIPNSVTTIGYAAFLDCSGFTGNVYLSDNLTSIGAASFAGTKISEINVSQNNDNYCSVDGIVYSKDKKTVVTCPGGKTGILVILDGVTTIGNAAFRDCSGFTGELVIPDSVTSIEGYAFRSCSGFTGDLVIPDSVTSIEGYAFSSCSGFTGDLVIGDSVTSIDYDAFYNCSGFTGDLVIGDSVTDIGISAFYGCSGFTGDLVIPNSVTSIGDSAFIGCSGLTGELVVPNTVTVIGNSTFNGCSGLTGLVIGNSVENIGNMAFNNCTGMTGYLVLANTIENIGRRAFYNCGINDYRFEGDAPTVVSASETFRSFDIDDRITYPEGNDTWEIVDGKWNGYTAKDWIAKKEASVTVSAGKIVSGKTGTVTVDISENSGAAIMQFTVKYDPSLFEVVSCKESEKVSGATINYAKAGEIIFVWESLTAINEGGSVLEIEFKVKDGVSPQKTVVNIDRSETFIFMRKDKTDIAMDVINGIAEIVNVIYGDISGDGAINVIDAYYARLIAAKLETPTDMQMVAGDVDGDGKITAVDANYIRKFAAKIITTFPNKQ